MLESLFETNVGISLLLGIAAIVGLWIAGCVLYFAAVLLNILLHIFWRLRGFILGTAVSLYLGLDLSGVVFAAFIGGLLVFLFSGGRNGRSRSTPQPTSSRSSDDDWWSWSTKSTQHSDLPDNTPTINPSTGLPMIDNNIDMGGNSFGEHDHSHSTGMDDIHGGI